MLLHAECKMMMMYTCMLMCIINSYRFTHIYDGLMVPYAYGVGGWAMVAGGGG